MALVAPVCGFVDALSFLQQRIIEAINGKFLALRRLADLLMQLSAPGFIPNISALIPISSIDISLYENLRSSCPFLKLPPASADPGVVVGQLQAQVNMAYGQLIGMLMLNPLGRLSKLQAKMDDYMAQFNLAALQGTDFMRCLQAACAAASAVEDRVSSLASTSPKKVAAQAQAYLTNIVNGQAKVLSAEAQGRVDTYKSTVSSIKKLQDVPSVQLPKLPSWKAPTAP
jgi:hypothetical protein